MSRPRKNDDEKRSERLPGLRLTIAERIELERKAEAAGVTVMEFQRAAIAGVKIAPAGPAPSGRLLVELNRVGVNLNQIARQLNRGRDVGDDARHVLARLYQVIDAIGRAHGA